MLFVCPPPSSTPLKRRAYLLLKSIFDRAGAGLLLVVFFPFLLLTAILSARETGKWPIMRKPYLGRGGSLFFRIVLSPAVKEKAGAWTTLAAGRLFSFLLTTIHVACGEMSFVGPTPIAASDAIRVRNRLCCESAALRPGVTGLWDLKGRSPHPTMTGSSDVFYYYGCSLRMDAAILASLFARHRSE